MILQHPTTGQLIDIPDRQAPEWLGCGWIEPDSETPPETEQEEQL